MKFWLREGRYQASPKGRKLKVGAPSIYYIFIEKQRISIVNIIIDNLYAAEEGVTFRINTL